MKIFFDKLLTIPIKAVLNDVALAYKEIPTSKNDVLELEVVGADMFLHSRNWVRPLYRQIHQYVSLGEFIKGVYSAYAYAAQLDRWKKYCDALPTQLKQAPIMKHLNCHLNATILQATTQYQRSEAVGLALAKANILTNRLTIDTIGQTMAIGGSLAHMTFVEEELNNAADLVSQINYYSCFRYKELFTQYDGLKRRLSNFGSAQSRYEYIQHYGIDLNTKNYDGILLLVEDCFNDKQFFLQNAFQHIRKPIVVYEFSSQRFDSYDAIGCAQVLLEKMNNSR